jgi:hypothetical protein
MAEEGRGGLYMCFVRGRIETSCVSFQLDTQLQSCSVYTVRAERKSVVVLHPTGPIHRAVLDYTYAVSGGRVSYPRIYFTPDGRYQGFGPHRLMQRMLSTMLEQIRLQHADELITPSQTCRASFVNPERRLMRWRRADDKNAPLALTRMSI